jgi:hypothetical protein
MKPICRDEVLRDVQAWVAEYRTNVKKAFKNPVRPSDVTFGRKKQNLHPMSRTAALQRYSELTNALLRKLSNYYVPTTVTLQKMIDLEWSNNWFHCFVGGKSVLAHNTASYAYSELLRKIRSKYL